MMCLAIQAVASKIVRLLTRDAAFSRDAKVKERRSDGLTHKQLNAILRVKTLRLDSLAMSKFYWDARTMYRPLVWIKPCDRCFNLPGSRGAAQALVGGVLHLVIFSNGVQQASTFPTFRG